MSGRLIKLTLEYDGTDYHGWQIQPRLTTIQGTIEKALRQLTGKPIRISGAGRTDAGVHAFGQVAHFAPPVPFDPETWVRGLNALLPGDISVQSAEEVPASFHARFSAKKKTYAYFIYNSPRRSPLRRRTAWHVFQALDLSKMRRASRLLTGHHDFTSLCAAGSETEDRIVDLEKIEIRKTDSEIKITFQAPRFLQHMVRNLVGLLVEVGRGRRAVSEISGILEGRDRRLAGPTAPPQGLFLMRIAYE
ncbi:MAG: tRNA pseudouridine(38-40) synthase TruA [Candidatus Manganitrophaceae bacterium]|nr:MAG: tRNA pseudouridine(38-40) synthase TruA [Candidatus Manganitrophaceae bacterium]